MSTHWTHWYIPLPACATSPHVAKMARASEALRRAPAPSLLDVARARLEEAAVALDPGWPMRALSLRAHARDLSAANAYDPMNLAAGSEEAVAHVDPAVARACDRAAEACARLWLAGREASR